MEALASGFKVMVFSISLLLAIFLCALVAGFLFSFAVVIMPGIQRLGDAEFVRAFQAMDGIIQNNQPLFILVWFGSILSVLVAAVSGFFFLEGGGDRLLVIAAAAAYLLAVQLPTVLINVPLNNALQSVDTHAMDETGIKAARERFESRWNLWNIIRTVMACVVVVMLICV